MPLRAILLVLSGSLWAQGPVILQRGVVNAVTLAPAPSTVAPGDLLLLRGLNLGPAAGVTAPAGAELPTELGGVQVFIATRASGIFFVSPDQVRVRVPLDAPMGLVNVVVQRGEQRSRAAVVRIVATVPAAVTANKLGFGSAGAVDGKRLTLSMTGLGLTNDEGAPRIPVRAYVGGLPAAEVKVAASVERAGEFDVTVELPESAQPGDLVSIANNGAAPANRSVLGAAANEALVQFVRLPAALRDVRAIRQSDLRGAYLTANGPRGADGCFPTWVFDMAKGAASPVESCLVAAQNAVSPVNPVNESHVLASFVGPLAEQANAVASKVGLFNPSTAAPMTVELPGPAAVLGSAPDGSVLAAGAGGQYLINPESGEVRQQTNPGGGAGAGGVAPGGAQMPGAGFQVDLGDGISFVLSQPMGVGGGTNVVVVGNSQNEPTRAKLALLGAGGAVTGTRDFPANWLPLVPPAQPAAQPGAPVGGGGGGGGAAGPGGVLAQLRLPVFFDAATRAFFVLAKTADRATQGFVAFAGQDLAGKELPFPAGWFAASCAPNVPLFNLELSRRVAMFASKRAVEEPLTPCPSQGYLALDLAAQTWSAVPLPGVGEVNMRAASGEVNDFLFAANTDAQNAALSDTLYIYDSVAGSPFRLDLPPGIVGFQQIVPAPALNGLVATAIGTRVAGDGGLVFFDLENEKTTVFPVPEGFNTVTFIAVFPNTRKLIARGLRANGTQYLIYDLTNGNLIAPPNPEGVAFAGPLPAQAPGMPGMPGQPQQPQAQVQAQLVNAKANTIAALAYDANRALIGLMTIKVP